MGKSQRAAASAAAVRFAQIEIKKYLKLWLIITFVPYNYEMVVAAAAKKHNNSDRVSG